VSEDLQAGAAGRRFFTTTEVARYCAVSSDGVLRWIKAGKLRGFATPGGHYRIPADAFREFLERFTIPIDEAFFSEVGPNRRVLIVDDDPEVRRAMQRMLREIDPGIAVEGVADGYAAGIRVGARGAELVILDMTRPRIDALALCRSIRANAAARGVKVLLLAAAGSGAREAFDAGADSCLAKPLQFEELRHEIRRLFGETPRKAPRIDRLRSRVRRTEPEA